MTLVGRLVRDIRTLGGEAKKPDAAGLACLLGGAPALLAAFFLKRVTRLGVLASIAASMTTATMVIVSLATSKPEEEDWKEFIEAEGEAGATAPGEEETGIAKGARGPLV